MEDINPCVFTTSAILFIGQIVSISIILEPMYTTIRTTVAWVCFLSFLGIVYQSLYVLFSRVKDKFLQEAKRRAEEQIQGERRHAKECEIRRILDNLTEQEVSLLKYILYEAGIIWLPNVNTQVLGLRASGVIEVFDKKVSCYRGDKVRQVCLPYKLTGFATENQDFIRDYLSSKYATLEMMTTMSDYQVEDEIILP